MKTRISTRKRLLCLLFALYLLINCSSAALATTPAETRLVAIGDSIAAGYGLPPDRAFPSLLAKKLDKRGGRGSIVYENTAVSGLDSAGLLESLYRDSQLIDTLKDSDLIVVSIGGNNILGPILDTVRRAAKSSRGEPLAFAQELANLVLADTRLYEELAAGAAGFARDLLPITVRLRELAPEAEIYIGSLYSPTAPQDGVIDAFAQIAIGTINSVIKNYSRSGQFTAVDVYSDFAAGDPRKLTNFNLSELKFDPHPNQKGHELIAALYYAAMTASEP